MQEAWGVVSGGSERGSHELACMMPHIAVAVSTCTADIDPSACHMQMLLTVLIQARSGMEHGT